MGMWLWRGIRWLGHRWRPQSGWTLWALAGGTVLWPAWTFIATEWIRRETTPLVTTALLAFLLAWWVWGRISPPWAIALGASGLYPVLLTTVARVWPEWPLWAKLVRETAIWLLTWGEGGDVAGAWSSWAAAFLWRWTSFHQALSNWAWAALNGTARTGQLALIVIISTVLYLVAWWVVWAIRHRRDGLLAALPTVVFCGWNAYLSGRSLWWLVGSLSLAALLAVLTHYQSLEGDWQRRKADYSDQLQLDFTLVALSLAAGILTLSPILPALASPRLHARVQAMLRGPWQRVEQEAARLFPDITRPADTSAPAPVPAGLPRAHKLGAGPDLLDREVMQVRPQQLPWPEGVYWFGRAYDVYTGQGWISSPWQPQPLAAGEAWTVPDPQRRRLVGHTVRFAGAVGDVYAAGMPVAVDQPARLLQYGPEEWVGMELVTPVRQYTVLAAVPAWDEPTLLTASTDYPEPIRRRYLQLPDTLPERVRALAQEITREAQTPYEKARAIEAYLRQIPYSLDIPTPPADRDLVDWFLFDLRLGYCDYYATAFVVLARLNGLPTRFVIGYAQGEWDPAAQVYRITERDAHSWPEVYFPGVGWVPFEPTAIRVVPRWSASEAPSTELANSSVTTLQRFQEHARWRWRTVLLRSWLYRLGSILAGILALLAGGIVLWWTRLPSPARAYAGLLQLGRLLGVPHVPAQTPREYAVRLLTRLAELSHKVHAFTQGRVFTLVDHYVAWRYGPRQK